MTADSSITILRPIGLFGELLARMAAMQTTSQPTEGVDPVRAKSIVLLGEVFSSKVRATLLAWVVPRLDTRFSLTELSREVGAPISSLQHECYKLERLGVLQGRREGSSRRYHMDISHRLSRPLINLVIATLGLETMLRESLAESGSFTVALIAGPDPANEADEFVLALIGDSDLEGLDRAQQRIAMLLDLDPDRIELAYFQADDWLEHGEHGHPLIRRLANRPIQNIIGAWPPDLAKS
jgi:hypothetical protein